MDQVYARRVNNQLCIDTYASGDVNHPLTIPGNSLCEGVNTRRVLNLPPNVLTYCGVDGTPQPGKIPCNGCLICRLLEAAS